MTTIPRACGRSVGPPARTAGRGRVAAILGLLVLAACTDHAAPIASVPPSGRGGVTFIAPRCAEVRSCLVGQVTAADTSAPLSRAAVFLERDDRDGPGVRILTLTDEQGVFTVVDAPTGRYRLAIYKDARRLEARGLKLGEPGTTLVPVRLPAS
jgi:hypothetical protein